LPISPTRRHRRHHGDRLGRGDPLVVRPGVRGGGAPAPRAWPPEQGARGDEHGPAGRRDAAGGARARPDRQRRPPRRSRRTRDRGARRPIARRAADRAHDRGTGGPLRARAVPLGGRVRAIGRVARGARRPRAGRDGAAGVIHAVLATAALAYVAGFVWTALARIGHPFELEWMGGAFVDHVCRVLDGQSIYVAPSADFVPFLYTPLYMYASAAVARVIGEG